MDGRIRRRPLGFDQSLDASDGLLDGRACSHGLVPAGKVGATIKGQARKGDAPHPAEMGDVGDREVLSGDEGLRGELRFEQAKDPFGFGREPRLRDRLRLRRRALEEAGIAKRWAQARSMEEELFEDAGATDTVPRQELAGLLGEIDEDGSALGQHEAVIDQDRHLAVRIESEKRLRFLLSLADIHRSQIVGYPHFFEGDQYLDAVRGGKGVDFDHRLSPSDRVPLKTVMTIPRNLRQAA